MERVYSVDSVNPAWNKTTANDEGETSMTWIATIPPAQADSGLREIYQRLLALYPPEYLTEVPAVTRADGTADSISFCVGQR
jgi:hypothetical protein